MQMEPDLTLEKAVSLARQSESVKTQQPTVRGVVQQETAIEVVKGAKTPPIRKYGTPQAKLLSLPQGASVCGKPGPHSRAQCPAMNSYVINVANWGTTNRYAEVSRCSQELEQWKKKTIPS